jgi:hypothetical protein
MSLRTIVSIAALVIIGIASVSTDTFARAPAGTTRLHHKHVHHQTVHHSGAVRHARVPRTSPLQDVGR